MTDFTDARETIRCLECGLIQFLTHQTRFAKQTVTKCRRCRKPFPGQEPPKIAPEPSRTVSPGPSLIPREIAVGMAFRALRLAYGWSQGILALRYAPGTPYRNGRTYISKIENGYVVPSLICFLKLCDALETHPSVVVQFIELIRENGSLPPEELT